MPDPRSAAPGFPLGIAPIGAGAAQAERNIDALRSLWRFRPQPTPMTDPRCTGGRNHQRLLVRTSTVSGARRHRCFRSRRRSHPRGGGRSRDGRGSRRPPARDRAPASLLLATSVGEAPTTTSSCLLHGLLRESPEGPSEVAASAPAPANELCVERQPDRAAVVEGGSEAARVLGVGSTAPIRPTRQGRDVARYATVSMVFARALE
jgi:hypothetical protein